MAEFLDIDHLVEDAKIFMVMPAPRRATDPRKPVVGDEVFLKLDSSHGLFVEVLEVLPDAARLRGRSTQDVSPAGSLVAINTGDMLEFSRTKIGGVYKSR